MLVLLLQKKPTKPCSMFLTTKEANSLHQSDKDILPSVMSSITRWQSMLPKTATLLLNKKIQVRATIPWRKHCPLLQEVLS